MVPWWYNFKRTARFYDYLRDDPEFSDVTLVFEKECMFETAQIMLTNSNTLFTESAHWAGSVLELRCRFVCLSVCLFVTIENTLFRRSWRLLVEGRIANIDLG